MTTYKKYGNYTTLIMPVWFKDISLYKYTKWALDSLEQKTNSDFELILFNNEATKESLEFLEKFRKKFEQNKYCKGFKILSSEQNKGWTGALECGIDESNAKYVCFLNNDLVFSNHWLERLLNRLKEKNVGAVGPTSDYVSGRQNVSYNKVGEMVEKVNWLIGFCILFKREALDEIKKQKGELYYVDPLFYPGGAEEIDICIRLAKAGYSMQIVRDVFIHHFGSKTLSCYDEFKKGETQFNATRLEKLFQKHQNDEYRDIIVNHQLAPKIVIGIPTVGEIDSVFLVAYHWLIKRTMEYFGNDNVIPVVAPRNLIHLSRSLIARKALTYGASYLFFIDDDMIPQPDLIIKLYEHQKDYICALAYTRRPPFDNAIYKGQLPDGKYLPYDVHHEGVVEIDCSGLACSLIKMDAIKKLLRIKEKEIHKRGGLFYLNKSGEDFNLTNELREDVGIKLYCDTNIVVDHLGEKQKVNHVTHDSYKEYLLQKEQQQIKKNGENIRQ